MCSPTQKESIFEELINDLRFAFNCRTKTKSVKKKHDNAVYTEEYDYSPQNYNGPDFVQY